jgi:hypothetical protein
MTIYMHGLTIKGHEDNSEVGTREKVPHKITSTYMCVGQ